MLGRHVYRVHPETGIWTVAKEGATEKCGEFGSREAAIAEACRLAEADQPSRVIIDDGDGIIVEERLFGRDVSSEIDAATR